MWWRRLRTGGDGRGMNRGIVRRLEMRDGRLTENTVGIRGRQHIKRKTFNITRSNQAVFFFYPTVFKKVRCDFSHLLDMRAHIKGCRHCEIKTWREKKPSDCLLMLFWIFHYRGFHLWSQMWGWCTYWKTFSDLECYNEKSVAAFSLLHKVQTHWKMRCLKPENRSFQSKWKVYILEKHGFRKGRPHTQHHQSHLITSRRHSPGESD